MNNKSESTTEGVRDSELDHLNYIDVFDEANLRVLTERIERSRTIEQLIYREAELDEVWRLIDGALHDARRLNYDAGAVDTLTSLRDTIMRVHDLIGVDEDTETAASELRSAVFLTVRYSNLVKTDSS